MPADRALQVIAQGLRDQSPSTALPQSGNRSASN
jgi:hypothetical protein